MPSAVSMASSDSRTTASYSAACSRVSGTGWSVSVLGGSSGTMPGSDFLRRRRKGRTRRASRSTASSSSPFSTARACRARKDFSGPSRPGVVQSSSAHSSERLFSTGVPVSATRAGVGIVRSAFAVAEYGFLTCCASSATTMPQVRARPASAAVDRIVPYVVRTKPPSRSSRLRSGPWKRRTGTPGAKRVISRCQLPSREAGQTTRVGSRPGPLQVQGDDGDRLAEAHVVGQAAAEAEGGHEVQPGQAPELVVAQGGVQARRRFGRAVSPRSAGRAGRPARRPVRPRPSRRRRRRCR